MNQLRFTDTNSADDSLGGAFGLDGNQYLVIVIALIFGIGIIMLLYTGMHVRLSISAIIGGLPVVVATSYILIFKRNKPAGYDIDLFDTVLERNFSFNPLAKRSPLFTKKIQDFTSEPKNLA